MLRAGFNVLLNAEGGFRAIELSTGPWRAFSVHGQLSAPWHLKSRRAAKARRVEFSMGLVLSLDCLFLHPS